MNKGVVVQLDYDVAYILKNDGTFVTYPRNTSWQIGDVVTLTSRPRLSLKVIIASCAIFICLFIGTGIGIYQIPSTYIEISVNPSVQLTLNRFDRVLSIKGLNDDGDKLLQGLSYQNSALNEAYAWLFSRLENNGYLGAVTIQLIIANNSQKTIDRIEKVLRSLTEKHIQFGDTIVSIKRYANDEYLSLAHPLPIMEIPNAQRQTPSVQQTEAPTYITPESLPSATPQPPSDPMPPQSTAAPSSQPGIESSLPPGNAPTTPSVSTPNYGNRHNGNRQHGNWQNGWWDWDCGW